MEVVKSKKKTRTPTRSMSKLQKARFEALNAFEFRCVISCKQDATFHTRPEGTP
jgi:hypothetical protein